MQSNQGSMGCRQLSWIIAVLAGLLLALILIFALDWTVFWGLVVGIIVAVALGLIFVNVFCGARSGAAVAASSAPAPAPEPEPAPEPAPAPAPEAAPGPAPAPAPEPTPEGGARPAGLDGPRGGAADDLKKIKGIGPALERLCNELGFYHFDQIAAWTADEVAWVDENLKGFKGRVTRDTWVAQAKLLAAGGETEFSKKVDEGDVY